MHVHSACPAGATVSAGRMATGKEATKGAAGAATAEVDWTLLSSSEPVPPRWISHCAGDAIADCGESEVKASVCVSTDGFCEVASDHLSFR